MNLLERMNDRTYIAIILIVATIVLLVVTWIWLFSLQKKIEKIAGAHNAAKKSYNVNCDTCYWRDRESDSIGSPNPCDRCGIHEDYDCWRSRGKE